MALKSLVRFAVMAAGIMHFSISAAMAQSTGEILQSFADDYARDPMARSIVFGIEIEGERWHIVSDAEAETGAKVELLPGFPTEPVFYFTTDRDMLGKIYQGAMSGLTAMGAAYSSDATPLDVLFTEGYQRPSDYDAVLRPLIFHFWTRGLPEVVPLLPENSRAVHGAPAVVMYYAEDFRSAVYHIPPRLGPDMAPTMTVPFPRVLVTLTGTMTGTVGGNSVVVPAGHMVMIPPNVPGHLWNEHDEPMSMMFLMFGDGA